MSLWVEKPAPDSDSPTMIFSDDDDPAAKSKIYQDEELPLDPLVGLVESGQIPILRSMRYDHVALEGRAGNAHVVEGAVMALEDGHRDSDSHRDCGSQQLVEQWAQQRLLPEKGPFGEIFANYSCVSPNAICNRPPESREGIHWVIFGTCDNFDVIVTSKNGVQPSSSPRIAFENLEWGQWLWQKSDTVYETDYWKEVFFWGEEFGKDSQERLKVKEKMIQTGMWNPDIDGPLGDDGFPLWYLIPDSHKHRFQTCMYDFQGKLTLKVKKEIEETALGENENLDANHMDIHNDINPEDIKKKLGLKVTSPRQRFRRQCLHLLRRRLQVGIWQQGQDGKLVH